MQRAAKRCNKSCVSGTNITPFLPREEVHKKLSIKETTEAHCEAGEPKNREGMPLAGIRKVIQTFCRRDVQSYHQAAKNSLESFSGIDLEAASRADTTRLYDPIVPIIDNFLL